MNRSLLVVSQISVVLFALLVRLFAPGWWVAIVMMSLGMAALIVLSPLVLAGIMAAVFAPSLRPRTLITLAVADLAVLSFALTLPDFTDSADDHLVPLAALIAGDGNVSASAANIFGSAASVSAVIYTIAGLAVFVLAVFDYRHANRAVRPDRFLVPGV